MAGAFFILTFAGTWTAWAAAAGIADPNLQTIFVYAGTFMPAFVALSLTARTGGVRALLEPLLRWRVQARWYVFALGFMLTIKLSVAGLYRLAFGAWPRFGPEPLLLMLGATVASVLVGGQTGEEIGWRGYALPRLAARMGLAPASILLGVIWASWHLPLFFLFPGADTHGQSFPLYLLQVTALSVVIAWLWWRTGGSLLLTMLLHSAVNNTKDIVPSVQPGSLDVFALSNSKVAWMTVALLWIAAAFFLVQMARRPSNASFRDGGHQV